MNEGLVTRPGLSAQAGVASTAREPSQDSTVLRLRGLPFSTTPEEVVAFFEDSASLANEK